MGSSWPAGVEFFSNGDIIDIVPPDFPDNAPLLQISGGQCPHRNDTLPSFKGMEAA